MAETVRLGSSTDEEVIALVHRRASKTLARARTDFALDQTLADDREVAVSELAAAEPPRAPSEDEKARRFPGHEDLEVSQLLAEGGMGRVLLAKQRSLQRDVAVKTVRPEIVTDRLCRELLDESVIAGSLEHPNIIPVHSLGFDEGGRPFLVMKRAEGVAWGDLIDYPEHPGWEGLAPAGGDRLAVHLDILRSVCSAVHYAHRAKVIHRDIKPANVMVGELGEVYLVDWGIATSLDPEDPRYRLVKLGLVGTPIFMAPEMVEDAGGTIDERTDVYLLGATLHYLLTRRGRHTGKSMGEVFVAAWVSAPVDYGPEVPEELGAIANRATHKEPSERFQTAAAFRAAITDFLSHRASIALSDGAAAQLEELRAERGDEASSDEAARLGRRQRLAECRWGFEQALKSWAGNVRAKEGLRGCTRLALEGELARKNLVGAEELLLDLEEVPEALAASIEALRAEHRAREARDARFRERERREDWKLGGRTRLSYFLGLGALGIAGWLWANGGSIEYRGQLSPWTLVRVVGALLAISTVVTVLLRKKLMESQVNERLALGVLFTLTAIFVQRIASCFAVPYTATLVSTECVFCAYGAALGGLMVARWLWLQVPLWLAGAVMARVMPSLAGMMFASAALASFGVAVWRVGKKVR